MFFFFFLFMLLFTSLVHFFHLFFSFCREHPTPCHFEHSICCASWKYGFSALFLRRLPWVSFLRFSGSPWLPQAKLSESVPSFLRPNTLQNFLGWLRGVKKNPKPNSLLVPGNGNQKWSTEFPPNRVLFSSVDLPQEKDVGVLALEVWKRFRFQCFWVGAFAGARSGESKKIGLPSPAKPEKERQLVFCLCVSRTSGIAEDGTCSSNSHMLTPISPAEK